MSDYRAQTNLLFFTPRRSNFGYGYPLQIRDANQFFVPFGRMQTRGPLPSRFDVDILQPPAMVCDHRKVDVVYRGSFVEKPSGVLLQSPCEDPLPYYLMVRTGLQSVPDGGFVKDLMGFAGAAKSKGTVFQPVTHGVVALHSDTHAGLVIGTDIALPQAMATKVGADSTGFMAGLRGIPAYVYRVFRMPENSGVLIRDIGGDMCRVVYEKGEIQIRDAGRPDSADRAKFHEVFDMLTAEKPQAPIIQAQAA